MKITVVGGSGFIGTHLVAALVQRGHAVRIFDRRPSARFDALRTHGDCTDAAALARALRDTECVVDLAAPPERQLRNEHVYLEASLAGVRAVIAAATACGVPRVLYNSSVAVYGPLACAATEDTALRPTSTYACSKCAAEALYRAWAVAQGGRSLVIVRPSVVFGEGNRGNVHRLIAQLQRNRFVMAGSGRNRKSIAYVGNFVDFACTCLDEPAGVHCFNYADPPPLATANLVGEILGLLPGARPPPRVPEALARSAHRLLAMAERLVPGQQHFGSERIRSFLAETVVDTSAVEARGFQRRFGLRDGLSRTIAAIQSGHA